MAHLSTLTGNIIGCAIEVHRFLGPGLLESTYERCLAQELHCAGLGASRQVFLPVEYKGIDLNHAYRVDLIVEDLVVLELKSVEAITPVHEAQVLTYLKLSGLEIGLLLNFNVPVLKDGIRRFIL